MQGQLLVICAFIAVVCAQRGHYAGLNRPILGSRYQTETAQDQVIENGLSNFVIPAAEAPIQGGSIVNNRFNTVDNLPYPNVYQAMGPAGFGSNGFGFPNQGFYGNYQPQGRNFGNFPFRRR